MEHRRTEYLQKFLIKERIAKLKSIGFVWKPPRGPIPGQGKRIKTATVGETQNDSHKRQTRVATTASISILPSNWRQIS